MERRQIMFRLEILFKVIFIVYFERKYMSHNGTLPYHLRFSYLKSFLPKILQKLYLEV